MTSRVDLEIRRGVTFRREFQWLQNYTTVGNIPVDITGCTIRMMVKHNVEDDVPLLDVLLDIDDGESGQFSISMDASETASMDFYEANYDILVTFPDQTNYLVVEGDFRVRGIVTREVSEIE